MVFSSLVFLFFFLPLTLAGYFACPNRMWRNLLLLMVSLAFYAWGEPLYVVLMIASIAMNWGLAHAMLACPRREKAVLVGGVAVNLLGIGVFKYAGFAVTNLSDLFGLAWPVPHVALPIGISFYTFMAVSYLVDVYRRRVRPQPNPLCFGTYLTMFPHLIAGPIVRYETIEGEIVGRRENLADFALGLRRFCIGLGKKVLIANTMGKVADALLAQDPTVGALPAWAAIAAYSFQIYFDFSAYSDMAIGLARMFGFHFLENFNYPYIAQSVTDFWRRWHISLSSFFRDYVYIPLGGSRVGSARRTVNLMAVWALTGLWHGASWNFVCWGSYFGLILIAEKLFWGRMLERLPAVARHGYTILVFTMGWVMFRIEDFALMGKWFGALFGAYGLGHPSTLGALGLLHHWPWYLVAAVGATPAIARLLARAEEQRWGRCAYFLAALGIFAWSSVALVLDGFNPFIYFRF
jgi:alginate O-acetyltransferase complex protein AlgI